MINQLKTQSENRLHQLIESQPSSDAAGAMMTPPLPLDADQARDQHGGGTPPCPVLIPVVPTPYLFWGDARPEKKSRHWNVATGVGGVACV